MGDSIIFYFCTRALDRRVAFGGPGDQVVAEEEVVAGDGMPRVYSSSLVPVGVRGQGLDRASVNVELGGECAIHVVQDALDQYQREMRPRGIMYE
jgi:hypothetical protein